MWRLTKRCVGGAALVLVLTGSAYGQEAAAGPPAGASRAPAPAAGRQEEPPGTFGSTSSGGLRGIFTGERLQMHVNGAYQASSRQDQTDVSFRTYGEQSQLSTRESFRGAAHLDVGGSLRVWRGLLLGASYTQMSRAGSATVTGTVPHPLDAGRDRTLEDHTVDLPYRERATHAYLGWRLTLRDGLDVDLSAGGTYFSLRQGVVAHLTPVEVGGPPFSEVGLQADTGEHTRNGAGFNAGIDITYMVTPATRIPQVGIGFFGRFTSGTVSLPVTADTWRRVTVGGAQAGLGLRFRF